MRHELLASAGQHSSKPFWQNQHSGETVSGASTITQQLARAPLFTLEERGQRSCARKIREAILAS